MKFPGIRYTLLIIWSLLLASVAKGQVRTDAREQVLALLRQNRTQVLSGQNLGHSNYDPAEGFRRQVQQLAFRTGHYPALLAVDYGYDQLAADFTATNQILLAHYRRYGLVSVSMHPPNPWRNSDCHDTAVGDLHELTRVGTAAHRNWMKTLDHVADGLSELQQLGVVVLWRPLHEMNGGWFWWGAHQEGGWTSAVEFRQLWRHMHNYYTNQKGLDNLLWVYSAAVQKGSGEKPADRYYPGDAYVDVVGLDWYDDRLDNLDDQDSYTQLAKLNKPFGLTEFGPLNQRDGSFDNTRILAALKRYPKLSFFVYWHSWPGAKVSIVDNRRSRQLMGHRKIATIALEDEGKP